MKKILSMVLIVAMLLSMVLVAIPASAADNVPEGYTPIENLDNLAAGGKYYLTKDITVNGRKSIGHNVVLDGGGHTVTYTGTGSLFGWAKNITVRNLNMVGSITDGSNYNAGGALTNGFEESATVENCTFDVDIIATTDCTSVGGVFSKNESGTGATVTFRNVVNNGDITVKCKVSKGIGGIMGWSTATTIFENCYYGGKITVENNKDTAAFVGGIIGGANGNTTLTNCVNAGTIELVKVNVDKNNGVGGLIGQVNTAGNSSTTASVVGGMNLGTVKAGANAPASHVGGIIGKVTAISRFSATDCVNLGTISTGTSAGWAGTGGIAGTVMTINAADDWWWSNVDGGDFDFTNCHNFGTVTGNNAAGILGSGRQLYNNTITIDITNCSNNGTVIGEWKWAGGMAARLGSDGGASSGIQLNVTNCVNTGNVTSYWEGAGMVARIELAGMAAKFDNCVNAGEINCADSYDKVAGIIRQSVGPVEIKNCANYGPLSGAGKTINKYPIAPHKAESYMSDVTADNNIYLEKRTDKDDATSGLYGAVAEKSVLEAKGGALLTAGTVNVIKTLDEYKDFVKYVEFINTYDETRYSEKSWNRVAGPLSVGNDIATGDLTVGEWLAKDAAEKDLIAGVAKLALYGQDTYVELQEAIIALETAVEEGKFGTMYLVAVNQALTEAKMLILSGETDEKTLADATKELERLMNLTDAMDARVVNIRTAEDFALMDGEMGVYFLENDITISEPVENFSGYFFGNGHMITTTGAIFETVDEAAIIGLVVNAGDVDADSLFGDVKTTAMVLEVTVLVDSVNSAVLFDNIEAGEDEDNTVDVMIQGVTVIVKDAVNGTAGLIATAEENTAIGIYEVFFNGTVNGKAGLVGDSEGVVEIYGAVIYGTVKGTETAVGVIGSAATLGLEAIYFEGTVDAETINGIAILDGMDEADYDVENCFAYAVDANGDVAEGADLVAIASGAAAYEINLVFYDLIFTQTIGVDAKPTMIGVADTEFGSNIVSYDSQTGKYYNNGSEYDSENVPEFIAPSAPAAPVIDTLNSVIATAQALDLTRYTAESQLGFATALEAALAARQALNQKDIDKAEAALLTAISALRVPVPTFTQAAGDATALNASIAAAEALKAEDYTAESWAAMQAVLANAKATVNGTQLLIDHAKVSLDAMVAALVKKVAEAPAAVDYSKLNAAVTAAEALVAADYTEGSWATLQAMLAVAKSASAASSQETVDQAQTALDRAVAGLVAAPAPEAPVEESGCGSVIGGAAVALVAVVALGAGVTFKKKED